MPFGGASYLSGHIFHASGAKFWHNATELRTLSVMYPLCGLVLIDTTYNLSVMCPLKLTYYYLFFYHQTYTILQGPLIPPMAFISCHDQGSNLLPPDGREYFNLSEWKAPISPNFQTISRILEGPYLSEFQNEGGTNFFKFWTLILKVLTYI